MGLLKPRILGVHMPHDLAGSLVASGIELEPSCLKSDAITTRLPTAWVFAKKCILLILINQRIFVVNESVFVTVSYILKLNPYTFLMQ